MEIVKIKVETVGAPDAVKKIKVVEKAVDELKAKGANVQINVSHAQLDDVLKKIKATAGGASDVFQRAGKSAADFGAKVGAVSADFSSGVSHVKKYIQSLDGMGNATVKAMGATTQAGTQFYTFSANVKKADGSIAAYKYSVNSATGEVYELSKGFRESEKTGESLLKNVIKNAQWYYISGVVSAITRAFKEALQAMKDADTELVNIQKVTGYSAQQIEKLRDNAFGLATAYGRVAQEVLEAETTFARAGYTDQIEQLAELAILTQNVGDVQAATASKFLIAADAAWKLNGSEAALMEILDGMNEVTNKNAVDMQALTEGLTVSASAFAEAGENAQMYTALVGAGVAATQRSGNEVARAMRTIMMNIRQIRGETEDGELIDEESSAKAAKALKDYADIVTIENGELRKTSDVLDELAGKWDTLGSVAQSAITEALAGKYRANILSALLNDWDNVKKIAEDYANGAGSALEENEKYMESWEAKTKQLSATWTEFISKTVDTGWIKGLLDALTWLIDGFDNLGNAILVFSGILVALKWNTIIEKFRTFGTVIKALPMLFSSAKGGAAGFDAGMKALNVSLTSTQLLISGVVVVISAAIIAFNKIKQAQEEARQAAIDAGKAATEEAGELKDLYQNYTDLRSAYQDGTATKQEFDGATERLLKKLGYEKDEIGELTEEYGKYHDAIRKATAAELEANLYDAKAATAAAGNNLIKKAGRIYGHGTTLAFDDAEQVRARLEADIDRRNALLDSGKSKTSEFTNLESRIGVLTDLLDTYDEALQNQVWLEGALKAAREGTLDSYDRENETAVEGTQLARENAEAISAQVEALQEYSKQLKTQKEDFSVAAQALAEYQTTGRVTADTQSKLVNMSSKYVQMLMDENGKLVVTEDRLRDVAAAIQDDATETESLLSITAKSSGVMDAFVTALKAGAKQAGATDDAVNDLVAQMIVFNNAGLSVEDKIAALQALALQAGITQSVLASVTNASIFKDVGMTVPEAIKKYGMSVTEASRYVRDQNARAEANEAALIDYWNSIADNIPKGDDDGGGGGGSSGGSASDANLTAHQKKVSLLKSELTLMQNQGRSADLQKEKMRQIQQALHAQAQYLRAIGGSQEDINALSAEWWEWQKKIKGEVASTQDLLSELQSALQDRLQDAADQRDAELAAIDEQIAALKRQKDEKDDQLKLEEKILAVQKAQADLANAQAERTIRQYNAKTGQWEWVADQKDVDDAKKALEKAEKDLTDFKEELEYNARLAELEAKKDAINAWYDRLEAQYKRLTDSLKEKTRGIGEILQDIWKNATPELKAVILENAEIFKAFGIDVKALSDAVNEAAREIYGLTANGDRYDIKSEKGQDFIKNAKPGDKMTGSDGSTWVKNRDGSVTITDKWGRVFTVDGSTGGSGGGADTGYGGDEGDEEDFGGGKYSGTVYAVSDDGKKYKISSAKGLNFLNTAKAGARMEAGDGSVWVKKANGRTVITDKYGRIFTVYDQGGLLRGMGGIKATAQDELVLPPDLTQLAKQRFASVKNIAPSQDAQSMRLLDGMRQMLGAEGGRGGVTNASYDNRSVGTQYNGDIYNLNGMTFTEQQVGGMTMREFVRSARTLAICKNGN